MTPLTLDAMLAAFDVTVHALALACQDSFEAYHGLLAPGRRFASSEWVARGVASLLYQGRPLVLVPELPAGVMAFVSRDQAGEFPADWYATARNRRRIVRAVMRDARTTILDRRVA